MRTGFSIFYDRQSEIKCTVYGALFTQTVAGVVGGITNMGELPTRKEHAPFII